MILNDIRIMGRAATGMITPFVAKSTKGPGGTSFGLSSFGYDVRVGREWVEYRTNNDVPLDPAVAITEDEIRRTYADTFVLRPNSFVLAHTMEVLSIPRDCLGLVKDKSSLARLGLHVQNTVLEPGWSGEVTLEIYNNSPRPVILRAGQGIAQVIFETGDPCYVSYSDRKGKYQGQSGVTLPRSSGEVAA